MVASLSSTPLSLPALIDELTATVSEAEAVTLREMLPAIYDELRRVAAGFLRDERPEHTLQPTALVHEAYLRMADQRQGEGQKPGPPLGIFAPGEGPVFLRPPGAPPPRK